MRVFQMLSLATAAAANGHNSTLNLRRVHIVNGCDESLTITGVTGWPQVFDNLGVLQSGGSMTRTPNASQSFGRGSYQAYYSESDIGQAKYGSFEYQVEYKDGRDRLNGCPSNVEVFAIPVTVKCAADGRTIGCTNNPTSSDVRAAMGRCPTARPEFGSVSDSRFCYSAGRACLMQGDAPYCGNSSSVPMQRAMRRFGGSGYPDSSKDAYWCAASYTQDDAACVRLHRGVSDPGGDPSSYYTAEEDGVPLYNEYAKWVHELCGITNNAFPEDGYGQDGGCMECEGDVTVTFCSGGSIIV